MALFDVIYVVDWSANNSPKTGRDSIWIAAAGSMGATIRLEDGKNFATRAAAKDYLYQRFTADVAAGRQVLAGFDFPQGYPQGFAAAAQFSAEGLAEAVPWQQVWRGLSAMIVDHPDNRSNRFDVAAVLNQRISGGAYPFWGRPHRREIAYISATKPRRAIGKVSLAERRITDLWVPRAQPVWKLYTTGSVGSQALVGIPVLAALRWDPALADQIRVWPFETGLSEANARCITFAEVYPSLFPISGSADKIKDCRQVESVARLLAMRDRHGQLAADFAGPIQLTAQQINSIIREEGWILGAGTYCADAEMT